MGFFLAYLYYFYASYFVVVVIESQTSYDLRKIYFIPVNTFPSARSFIKEIELIQLRIGLDLTFVGITLSATWISNSYRDTLFYDVLVLPVQ